MVLIAQEPLMRFPAAQLACSWRVCSDSSLVRAAASLVYMGVLNFAAMQSWHAAWFLFGGLGS